MRLQYAIDYARQIRPNTAFPESVYVQWLNQVEGLIQTDVWMLYPEDVTVYHAPSAASGTGVSFPDGCTMEFPEDPGFYAGGDVVISGFSDYEGNNSEKPRRILTRSEDGCRYSFADGSFPVTGSAGETGQDASAVYSEGAKELLVPKPHDKLYLSYLLAMIDLANAETKNYANSITVFNEDYAEYAGYYGLNVNPADGKAEFHGYYVSAYAIARKNGFAGTEEEWLASLAGRKGDDGEPGAPFRILDMYGTLEELTEAVTTPSLGDMYAVGTAYSNEVYFWNGTAWVSLGPVNGVPGEDGNAATVTVGSVMTGEAGTAASVTNGGTENAAVLNFVIPRGEKGEKGADGSPGADGAQGEKGDPGEDFKILGYYKNVAALTAAVPSPSAGDAYGVGTEAPYDIYIFDGVSGTWVNNGTIQGAAGADGAPGKDGTDGREVELRATETYIQWRYAGETAWNNLVPLSSLKGADGAPGAAGADGSPGADGADGADGVGVSGVAFKGTDASGGNVYTITLTNGTTYDFTAPKGDTGAAGSAGEAGPNQVTTSTATDISGILKGNGSTVAKAVAGADYAAASHTHDYIPTSEKGAASGVATLDANAKVTADQASAKIATIVDVSYSVTPTSNGAGCFTVCTNANAITITLGPMTAETEIEYYRAGAGAVTFEPGDGVTFECKETSYGIADQYTTVVAKWRTESIVVLGGNVG